jgi:hypothetical protein
MKYIKTYEKFTYSSLNEEEELFKGVRKLLGRESDEDLKPLKDKFDAEMVNIEKQILANMQNSESKIKINQDPIGIAKELGEDNKRAQLIGKNPYVEFDAVAKSWPINKESLNKKLEWTNSASIVNSPSQILQVDFIKKNGWFDYKTGQYSTPEEMKGKELETLKQTWNFIKEDLQKKARELKYQGIFEPSMLLGKLMELGDKKIVTFKPGNEYDGKKYWNICFEEFGEQIGVSTARGGFHG